MTGESWKDQWWVPISWAISLVNSTNKELSQGCKLKEQKGLIKSLINFQKQLQMVSTYQNNPLPIVYGQVGC